MPQFTITQNRVAQLVALKERREGRKLTREVLARESGLGLSTVQSWYSNRVSRFDGEIIAAWCVYFNCTVGDLLMVVDTAGRVFEPLPETQEPLAANKSARGSA